jgi:hypothetical protein
MADVAPERITVRLRRDDGSAQAVSGQIVKGMNAPTKLCWVIPQVEPGRESRWTATLAVAPPPTRDLFVWEECGEGELNLLFGSRRTLRYMHAFDRSMPERLEETYKPYHHVFDSVGEKLLTKGPGGLYSHHRGIFIGWNKLKIGDKEYDFWHMTGVAQRHQRVLYQAAGPVLGHLKTLIHWTDPEGIPVISEEREVTVYRPSAPMILLLDFHTCLKAVAGDLYLDGDPEHAGVQYRAHNDVAEGDETVKATYVFHKDGIDAHKDENLPWAMMSYGLHGKRYTVQHMNHPDNPRPTLYSAYRDYGRFGAFFRKKLKAGETLTLRYRILITEGPMPEREELASRHAVFVTPPQVRVLSGTP